jgi:predicted GNAT family acetyltransferase
VRGSLTLLQVSKPALPTGCLVEMDAEGVQMVCLGESASRHAGDIVPLGDSDAPDMMELAQLTAPGPFAARTHRLGQFYGIRREGRLVAMTGERMRLPGFAEVSGVCTHPDWRGHGFAEQLCQRVIAAIRTRGETPFLHAIASNVSAVSLYEKLGFSIRTRLHVVKLMPDPASR